MRSLIIFSALLVLLVQCGYPIRENSYPTTPGYRTSAEPIPKRYGTVEEAAAEENPSESDINMGVEYTTPSSFRKRAKARTAHNRQFQRRPLQPIRRFQQKKH